MYPLITENLWFSDVIRRYIERPGARNGSNMSNIVIMCCFRLEEMFSKRLYSLGQACQTTSRFTVKDWLCWFFLTYLFRIIGGVNSNGTEMEPLVESFSGRGCIHVEVKSKAILYCGQY